ncbi:MAG TPA: Ig-like domain-containing protein [Gemmatimonadaceae bacterium]|nr:Ig-like domain-containing protein [Gemmatimonadaceae bacterium]
MASPTRVSGPAQKPLIHNAGKLVAMAASTGAALVSIISFLYSYGVIGKSASHQTIGNLGASWVGLRPAADTAFAIGDTIHLAATITDKSGALLVGATPTWVSENPKVATVLNDGSVIAQGPGRTTISIAVADLIARSRIVVKQTVMSVDVVGIANDTTPVVAEGERKPLRAIPRDARGHPVIGLVPQWRLDDTSVAAVDSLGGVTGKNAGRTIVTATVDGVTGKGPITIVATAAEIATVAGGTQRALAGSLLPQAVVVRVTSRRARPVEGVLVKFRLGDGNGTLDPQSALTDADGRARSVWTLGDLPGRQTMFATVDRIDSALAIVAEAEPVAANTRLTALNDHPSAEAGRKLSDTIAIRISDSTGRALADVPVTWAALDNGRVEAIEARSDSVGEARALWTFGAKAGQQRLRAQVGNGHGKGAVAPLTIHGTALAGVAVGLVVVSGDGQRGIAGEQLGKPLVMRVVDSAGNGVADAELQLSPSEGTVPDTSIHTDSNGIARVRWTLGHAAGEHALAVHLDGMEKLLKLTAVARPAIAANLSFDDSPSETRGSRSKGKHLIALVTDAFGNPVPDARLNFSTRSGSVSPSRAVSDAKGRVTVSWTLGTKPGDQSLIGSVQGTDVRGSFIVPGSGSPTKTPAKTASVKGQSSKSTKKRS